MTLLDDQLGDAGAVLVEVLGEPAVWRRVGLADRGCAVILAEGDTGYGRMAGTLSEDREAELLVRSADLPDPQRGDACLIASGLHAGTWTVRRVSSRGSGLWSCAVRQGRPVGSAGARAQEVRP